MLGMAPDYDHLPVIHKVEVFEYALDSTSGEDLHKVTSLCAARCVWVGGCVGGTGGLFVYVSSCNNVTKGRQDRESWDRKIAAVLCRLAVLPSTPVAGEDCQRR